MDKYKNEKRTVGNILLIIGVIFISYCIIYTIKFGRFNFGLGIISILSILSCIDGVIKKYIINKEKFIKICEIIFDGILIVSLIFFLFGELLIQSGLREKSKFKVNNMIVLGCGLEEDGEPSKMMKNRLNAAIAYLSESEIKTIIVSGGQGADEKFTEASVMKKYLVDKGINSEIIIEENKSTSTFENLEFSKGILEKIQMNNSEKYNIVIATSDFHMFRTKLIAKKLGFNVEGVDSSVKLIEIPYRHVREYFAIVNTIINDLR
ncbi:YdcF family protein [Oceanirhabdus sp. W0125-5]|uniref:YdcF family protein n=1 Tax=Oceanirhabdus sp. W0125-5 TaxID=2999116 RepID=UPI0022F33A2B|nr:YdcF family protein [Oceanirhabdus sp. W0125-5]WBW94859.1 YdcF family protein [Oceanirhabdus sp. W0125-5]